MTHINTSIEIDAPPSTVWETLADLPSYPEWNPHLTAVEGDLRAGERLRVRVDRAGAKPRYLTVTVVEVDPGRQLEWVGRLGHRLLFEGRHAFELEVFDCGRTLFHNREAASGLLVPFVVSDEPERDYEAMNEALKARVESSAAEE